MPLPTQQWVVGWELCPQWHSLLHTCMMCVLYSPRGDEVVQKCCVSYAGDVIVSWIWYRCQTLNYTPLPIAGWIIKNSVWLGLGVAPHLQEAGGRIVSFISCIKMIKIEIKATQHNPWGRLKRPYAITRLTALFMCDLVSDLVICKFRKSMGVHDTECPYWDQVSLNNSKATHCHDFSFFSL